jgi:hypothetical protein
MRPAIAAHVYDTFVSSMWRHDMFLTRISPADTKTVSYLDLLFMTRVPAKISYTEGNVKILRALLRLDAPMLYQKIQANWLVRTFLNVTAGDESAAVRDRAQQTLDNVRQMPCLQRMVASFTEPMTDAELQPWRLEDRAKTNQGRNRTVPPPGAEKADSFPPAMRLPTARAPQLALRYVENRLATLNTLQGVRSTETGRKTSKRVRTVLRLNEEVVVQDWRSCVCLQTREWRSKSLFERSAPYRTREDNGSPRGN